MRAMDFLFCLSAAPFPRVGVLAGAWVARSVTGAPPYPLAALGNPGDPGNLSLLSSSTESSLTSW